jgi:flagellar hook-basal body complex protein FliE
MIAQQKANITLQTAVEVRNKVIDAYQEMMRMQV